MHRADNDSLIKAEEHNLHKYNSKSNIADIDMYNSVMCYFLTLLCDITLDCLDNRRMMRK